MDMEQGTKAELLARLELIEAMMREGRKTTGRYGWAFVLWGVAFLIAIGWTSITGHGNLAWPVTMISAAVIQGVVGGMLRCAKPQTHIARSIGAIWSAVGITMFAYPFAIGTGGHFEIHALICAVEALLGVANGASAFTLRWRGQFLIALLWWISSAVTSFVPAALVIPILAAATLIGQIGFGLYLMYLEHRDRRTSTTAVQHG